MGIDGRRDGREHGRGVRRALLGVATLAVVALLAPSAIAQVTHDVDVQDDSFVPTTVEIQEGETVHWTQSGSNPHTVTAADGEFDSHPDCQTFADAGDGHCMEQGETYSHTFDEPGEYDYYCRLHGTSAGAGMAGTVVVTETTGEEAADVPDDDQGDPDQDEADAAAPDGTDEDGSDDLPVTGGPLALLVLIGVGVLVAAGTLTARRRR